MATTVADADVLVHADVSKFARELESQLKPITKSISASIVIDGDPSDLEKTVSKAKRNLERQKGLDVKVDADTDPLERSVATAKAKIAAGPDPKINVDVDVDVDKTRSRLISSVTNIGREVSGTATKVLGSAFSNLGGIVSDTGAQAFRTLITLVTQFVAIVPIAAGGVFLLAKAVLALLPLAAALPGALLAGAGVVGVLALGFRNLTDAITGDAEALQRLAPSAREVVEVLRGFGPAFSSIQKAVQQNLFAGLAGPIDQLVRSNLPGLRSALESIATSINTGVAQSIAFLNSETGKLQLGQIFASTANAVESLLTALPSLVRAFTAVAAAGARVFESIAPQIAGKIEEIANKITEFANSGNLERSFNSALTFAKELFGILQQLLTLARTVGAAISEGFSQLIPGDTSALEGLKNTLRFFQEFFSTPIAQQGFKLLGEAILIVVIAAAALVIGLITLLGVIQNVIEFIVEAWTNIINATKTLVQAVIGFFNGLIEFFSGVPGRISNAVSSVIGFLQSIFTAAFNVAKAAVTAGIAAIVGFVSTLPGRIIGALSAIGGLLLSLFSNAWGRARDATSAGINALAHLASSVASRIAGAIGNLGGLLFGQGAAVIQGLINGVSSKLGALRNIASTAASVIKNLFPHSPAKEGPMSGHGDPTNWGKEIVARIVTGMDKNMKTLRFASSRGAWEVASPFLGPAPARMSTPEPNRNVLDPITKALLPGVQPSGSVSKVTKTISPTINVHTTSADPEIVANKLLRRLLTVGAF